MFERSGPRDREDDARRERPVHDHAAPERNLGRGAILALQRTAGNAAVARMLARTVSTIEQGQLQQAITGDDAAAVQKLRAAQARVLALDDRWVDFIARLMAWTTENTHWKRVVAEPLDDLSSLVGGSDSDVTYGMANNAPKKVTMAANAPVGELDPSLAHEQTHAVLYALFDTSKPFRGSEFYEEFGQAILASVANVDRAWRTVTGDAQRALMMADSGLKSLLNNYGGLVPKNQGPIPTGPDDTQAKWMERWGMRVFNEVLPHFTEIVVRVTMAGYDAGYVYTAMKPLLDFLELRFFKAVERLTQIPMPALKPTPLPVDGPPVDIDALNKRIAALLAQTSGATVRAPAPLAAGRKDVLSRLRNVPGPPRQNRLGRAIRSCDDAARPACDAAQRTWPLREHRWSDVSAAAERAVKERRIDAKDAARLRGVPKDPLTPEAPEAVRELEQQIEASIEQTLALLEELSQLPDG